MQNKGNVIANLGWSCYNVIMYFIPKIIHTASIKIIWVDPNHI